ncbi:MAG: glycine-rich domain-containing protein-like [Drouetiella hepatica Uher 2000/2452]|jgi:hypothetical protein|uniref:Glycine-rich domain-containing protein-like n=1 Tax=Drouetiella hepatica Uher 2000/2452 TaxID=904376 RepID=A0A951QBZ6_9CYAN|nr:glycine-rich domain-containing protein-like [Drouetiella hepatica Uher 2000/2452]
MVALNQVPSQSFEIFLQKARQLDLDPIAYQLMQSPTDLYWTKPQVVKAIAQYLAFLYLYDRYPHLQLAPSLEIDQIWHCHILDTQKYAEDCQLLFGYMIHHFPYLGLRGVQDRRNQREAYLLTKRLFAKHFKTDSMAQNSLPGDCEPIRLAQLRSRPRSTVNTEEVLANLPCS